MRVHWLSTEESFQAFGCTLPDPFRILQMSFASALFLGCNELALSGMLHQFKCAWVSMLLPALAGIEKLGPGGVAGPVLLDML